MAHVLVGLLPARPALFGAALQKCPLLKKTRARFGVNFTASVVDSLSVDRQQGQAKNVSASHAGSLCSFARFDLPGLALAATQAA
jgi:hypothetical protein